jgi:hypothetical protein
VLASGTLNGIFNNAGIGLVKPFLEMDPASYHKVIDVDQHSVYYGMYYVFLTACVEVDGAVLGEPVQHARPGRRRPHTGVHDVTRAGADELACARWPAARGVRAAAKRAGFRQRRHLARRVA